MNEHRRRVTESLKLIAAAFERNGWEMSRQNFWQICKRSGVSVETAQAILEIDCGLTVDRKCHKKLATDRMHLPMRAWKSWVRD